MKMNEKTLLKIARLAAPELETLKVRNRDALDFIEVHVLGLKNAIRAAYDLGRSDAEKRARR
jgi:hypothetical protein